MEDKKYLNRVRCKRCGIQYLEIVFPEDVSAGQAVAECPRCEFNQHITSLDKPIARVLSLEEGDEYEELKKEEPEKRLVEDDLVEEPYEPKIIKVTYYEKFHNGVSTGHSKYYISESEEEEVRIQGKILTVLTMNDYERADSEEIDVENLNDIHRLDIDVRTFKRLMSII